MAQAEGFRPCVMVKSMVTAIINGDFNMVTRLLKRGVSVNQCFVNSRGTFSLLNVASQYGWLNIAQLLLKHGALMHVLGFDGCNSLVHASRCGNPQIAEFLVTHIQL
jgi:ankyrin repeat protein